MKIFNIPINQFGAPFNKAWKRVLLHFVIALIAAVVVYILTNPGTESFLILYFKITFYIFCGDIAQAFIHILIYIKLEEKYDWIKDTTKRVGYGILLHTAGTYLVYFTIPVLYMHYIYGADLFQTISDLANYWFIPITLVTFIMFLAAASQFFKNWKKSLASEAKLNAEMMNYKYESLRNQINPHFLLDGFSYLKKLVVTEKPKAVSFIQNISSLYRHVLEVKDKEFVALEEELRFIKSYVNLLKLRYNDQLDISIDISPEKNDLIAPLSLQYLVEIAVESNIHSEDDKLKVWIEKINGTITISNSKNPKKQHVPIESSRLKNLEQQYQFYSKEPLEIMDSEGLFSVKIPILKQA